MNWNDLTRVELRWHESNWGETWIGRNWIAIALHGLSWLDLAWLEMKSPPMNIIALNWIRSCGLNVLAWGCIELVWNILNYTVFNWIGIGMDSNGIEWSLNWIRKSWLDLPRRDLPWFEIDLITLNYFDLNWIWNVLDCIELSSIGYIGLGLNWNLIELYWISLELKRDALNWFDLKHVD